ncbi:hypothetical protein B0J11DRAFT_179932 [Dendryphion nanum]|uniref:Uncharacterized protein n=1 Tax=Dendryphion nanum TaxID=256645 RepID=A0A9P9IZ24_9PLEO|nr:hypothetical protein B0J11DRAFT_179932 [Dendryphion nanum]
MDEDIIAMCVMLTLFVLFPLGVAMSITSCIAYSRTKAWDKARTLKTANLESSSTLLEHSDDESDFYDTDDETEHNERKAEEDSEQNFTFNQKWRKEFRKTWSGKGTKQILLDKEREERKKLAKAVAREMDRRERRRVKKAAREAGQSKEADALPPYYKN